jgi:hypothetical protein
MLSPELLARAVGILSTVLVVSVGFVLGHGIWLTLATRYTRARHAAGRAALAGLVAGGRLRDEERARIAALPHYVQERLFLELSANFGGEVRDSLRELGTEVGAVRRAERRTRSALWWRRLRGVRLLGALGASEELVLARLYDRHPAVRASVAEWAGEHPSPEVLRSLLELLSSSGTLYRFAMQDALLRVGQAAAGPLAEYLSAHSGAVVLPALQVAAILAHPTLAEPARQLCRDPDPRVRARAAELLGAVGGEEGTAALCTLLDDPQPAPRAAAAHALGRLRHWPAASAVAPLLRDRAWDVRRAAGLALRELGSPGLLFLRRYQSDPDRFAADMATLVLDLPALTEEARG